MPLKSIEFDFPINRDGKKVQKILWEKGNTVETCALLSRCENYINKIENKRSMPSMSAFFNICEYLGVSPNEFFNA